MNTMDTPTPLSDEERAARLAAKRQMLIDRFNCIPFMQLIGAVVTDINDECARAELHMRDNLVGNGHYKILHGGVIASMLDSIGGIVAMAAAYGRMKGLPTEEKMQRMARLGTIDMRIDYLRPGRGNVFIATGRVVRVGSKICATQMTLHNDKDELIATGNAVFHY